MNAQSHKSGSPFKSLLFSSRLRCCCSWEGAGLVCNSVCKADLPSDYLGNQQSKESVDLPQTCYPSPSLTLLLFKSLRCSSVWCRFISDDL